MSIEHQNAYALSQATHDYGHSKVAPLVAAGLHVVVICGPAYCRFTDAQLPGLNVYVVSSHLSRRIAERKAAMLTSEQELFEEFVEVWPKPAREPKPALFDDDVPF